ncbi:hypothetical protein [Sorangium atrum]|uniref:Uncharacterized protein n=1 Tax=Sorangium atrum TaxID=2995308 RepID=A0ABT5BS31_9BACT|nr:hypothetical protein [Sorangium aterium]MDC0676980.1 hypothetical protein [Sorangium aterium]
MARSFRRTSSGPPRREKVSAWLGPRRRAVDPRGRLPPELDAPAELPTEVEVPIN